MRQLGKNGWCGDEWNNIYVVEEFTTDEIKNVGFSGEIFMGSFDKGFTLDGGVKFHSGLSNVNFHNCRIGNDVYVSDIANYIANYEICDNAFIENVSRIITTENATFGNGVRVSVLNEVGGRDVPMYDSMSAHLAYMLAMYRYRPKMIDAITSMIDDYTRQRTSSMGRVGVNAKIVNTNFIENVNIGDYSKI